MQKVPLTADKTAAKLMLAELMKKAERQRIGLFDPAEDHARRPLTDHLADYVAFLESKGNCARHTAQTRNKIATLLRGCGFVFVKEVDAGRVTGWLNEQRKSGETIVVPAGIEWFTPSEAAAVLGLTPAGLRAAVQRNRLAAVGAGKARRLPRATVESLAAATARGVSPTTVNHYVRAVRGFFRWLVRAKRIGGNPLDTLTLMNEKVDIRRGRRELTADELRRLFDAARTSAKAFRGLTGEERFALYLTAAATGFRANALANLTPADFALDDPTPTVTLPARFNKSRKPKVQPLPADTADALRRFLTDKPSDRPVWGGTWASDFAAADMIRIDLDTAGIPYAVEGPDGPRYADFHALRHTFLTLLGRNGVDLRTAQELAGHSTPILTARYSHRGLHDLAGAVGKLPPLVPGNSPVAPVRDVPGDVPTRHIPLPSFAQDCTSGQKDNLPDEVNEPLEMQQPDACSRRVASGRKVSRVGVEPTTRRLKVCCSTS